MHKISYQRDGEYQVVSSSDFESFNPSVLDIGDISAEGEIIQGAAAFFDLEGFTAFCNQVDPHLVVPEFLTSFLQWIFEELASELKESATENSVRLWCRLPFFAKFLGDGLLFVWDTRNVSPDDLGSLVVSLNNVRESYSTNFFPQASERFSKPPKRLRCGIARGQVISVGDGRDYVGACINISARLQKLSAFSFAFSRRGFDLKKQFESSWWNDFSLIKAEIRGIGEEELVYVLTSEWKALPEQEKSRFPLSGKPT